MFLFGHRIFIGDMDCGMIYACDICITNVSMTYGGKYRQKNS